MLVFYVDIVTVNKALVDAIVLIPLFKDPQLNNR